MQEREGEGTFYSGCRMSGPWSEGSVHDQLREQEVVL